MLHHVRKSKKAAPKTPLDVLIYFFVFTTPLFELPQAYLIYTHHIARDVSILSLGYFAVSSIFWILYGLRKRIKPIIFAYSLYLTIDIIIVIGIIRYS